MLKKKAKTYKYTVNGQGEEHRSSVRWHIFCYFLLFALIMLVLLWLLQTVFLETIYKNIKTRDIERTADHIVKTLEAGGITDDDLQDYLNTMAQDGSFCVRVADLEYRSEGMMVLQTTEVTPGCLVHHLSGAEILLLAAQAEEQGGSVIYTLGAKEQNLLGGGLPQLLGEQYARLARIYRQQADLPQLLLSVRCVTLENGAHFAILLNGAISPIAATVDTLRSMLLVVSGVMVLIALVLAFLTAERVSRPIVHINEASRRLAKGDFAADFRPPGAYREIDELAATLNYAAGELAKTESLQRDLIANISHDLRTPLTLITGYAEAMRDLPDETTPENVQVIIDETERLNQLVNDLLDMSKLQAGAVELSPAEFDLTDLVRRIIMRFNKLCATEGYVIEFEPGAELWVFADEVKLTQVIYNLLNNAITYTGEDKRVIIRQCPLRNNKRVRIEVLDTGEGIRPEQIENIWQRYYHGSANHRRTHAGNGLGLYIVKTILDLHGGAYGVESTPGEGSCFWFELEIRRMADLPRAD